MSTNYARLPGMGDLPGDSTNRNSPDYDDDDRGSILDDQEAIESWLADHAVDYVFENAAAAIADFMAGPQDDHAKQKFLRAMLTLADGCRDRIVEFEEAGIGDE